MSDLRLTAGEIFEEFEGSPLEIAESRVVVPGKGKLFFDTTDPKTGQTVEAMKIAVIRPCVSRGKKIRGMPPIYTPQMLAANADVFTDWPMYEDHLAEQAAEEFREQLAEANMGDVIEFLEERSRRIKELGGRVLRSYYNPELSFEDDEEHGYRRGGVEAVVVPQPGIKAMLQADPGILHNSINAWPTGARAGTAPWDSKLRGMLIEGIRRKPRGSVDFVFRGGAGGRPLIEGDGELAVSVLEAYYAAEHGQGPLADDMDNLLERIKKLKPGELGPFLREQHLEHLLPALREEEPPEPSNGNGGGLTEEKVQAMLDKQREDLEKKLTEHDEGLEDRVQEEVNRREGARALSDKAFALIREAEGNGFPKRWAENLRARYAVLPSGAAEGLRIQEADLQDSEGKTLTEEQLIEERVKADVQECLKLIEDAGGRPAPRGLGASEPDPQGGTARPKAPEHSAFRQHLRESGDIKEGEDAPSEDEQVASLVGKARGT